MKKLLLGAGAAACVMLSPAHAVTALTSNNVLGNQAWTGALGMDFDVLSAITVTQLGAFDSGGLGFNGPITVGIFDLAGSLVGTSFTFTSTNEALVGNDRFYDIVDFNLGVGSYSIVAVGFGSNDLNANGGPGPGPSTIDTGGGLISFVGNSRYAPDTDTTFALPSIIDGGPSNRYSAGTFQYVSAVPEPGTYALMLAGLAALGVQGRRKAKKAKQET